jgi:hypothetical protein
MGVGDPLGSVTRSVVNYVTQNAYYYVCVFYSEGCSALAA